MAMGLVRTQAVLSARRLCSRYQIATRQIAAVGRISLPHICHQIDPHRSVAYSLITTQSVAAFSTNATVRQDRHAVKNSSIIKSLPNDIAFIVKFNENINGAKANDVLKQILAKARDLLPERDVESLTWWQSITRGGGDRDFYLSSNRIHNVNTFSFDLARGEFHINAYFNILDLLDAEKIELISMVEAFTEVERVDVVQESSVIDCTEPFTEAPPFDCAFIIKFKWNIDMVNTSDVQRRIWKKAQELLPEPGEESQMSPRSLSTEAGNIDFYGRSVRIHSMRASTIRLAQGKIQIRAIFNVPNLTVAENNSLISMLESFDEVEQVSVTQRSSVVDCIDPVIEPPSFTGEFRIRFKQGITTEGADILVKQIAIKVCELLPDRREDFSTWEDALDAISEFGPRVEVAGVYSYSTFTGQTNVEAIIRVLDLTKASRHRLSCAIHELPVVDQVFVTGHPSEFNYED